jgi:hypothetical protein
MAAVVLVGCWFKIQWKNSSLPSAALAPQMTVSLIDYYTLYSLRYTELMISLNMHAVNLRSSG